MKVRPGWVALSLAAMVMVIITTLYLFFESWYHFWPAAAMSAVSSGVMVSGIVGCIAIYRMSLETIPSRMNAEDLRRRVDFHLRGMGYLVDGGKGSLTVRLDGNRNVVIKVRGIGGGASWPSAPA